MAPEQETTYSPQVWSVIFSSLISYFRTFFLSSDANSFKRIGKRSDPTWMMMTHDFRLSLLPQVAFLQVQEIEAQHSARIKLCFFTTDQINQNIFLALKGRRILPP